MARVNNQNQPYHVVVCGGGLAGLTLSLQLKKLRPELQVTVIEKTTRPLPDAAHKVGESTVEIGAHYFGEVLGLKSYLQQHQMPKLGLRYFYGGGKLPLEQRPELGTSMYSPVPSYQLDRGTFESDLREMALKAGIQLLEGASLEDIQFAEIGEKHQVNYSLNGKSGSVSANWVVDAMGRRRYLQTKFGLKKESLHSASAVWFRIEGQVSVNDLVPASNTDWHQRNIEDRYLSTNHLMGHGYWVWLIPLATGNTSIGIVTQNDIHDFAAYSRSYETSFQWLQTHEPQLAKHLEEQGPIDFRKIKNYSYGSEQLFSENRWSCVGEAGLFSDPFYSPGSDTIAITNTYTCNLILSDMNGTFSKEMVDLLNHEVLDVRFPDQLSYFINGYHTFGNTAVAATKFLWDTIYYWRVYSHPFLCGFMGDTEFIRMYAEKVKQLSVVNRALQAEFRTWAEATEDAHHFEFCNLAIKRLFIESAIGLMTRPKKEDYHRYLDEQLAFFTQISEALRANAAGRSDLKAFEPFHAFYGPISEAEKKKNRTNQRIAKIGNGALLYSFRAFYLRLFVQGKNQVHGRSFLRMLYSE
ncbi:MAG: tryptophan 7-halogenase [Flavobacteriales bacterium]|nr:tryptophan 7-halogenase [Flavobacteriales bacterium]